MEMNINFEIFRIQYVHIKRMRLDRGRPEIRSKLYSIRLLIDFFDPNLALQSIVATISIQIHTEILILNSIIVQKRLILL